MKQVLFYLSFVALIVLLSCSDNSLDCIRGSGNNVTEIIPIPTLTKLDYSGVGNVHYTQADSTSLVVKAPQVVIDNLTFNAIDNYLIIGHEKCLNGEFDLDIYITSPTIEEIEYNGIGKLLIKNTEKIENLNIAHRGIGIIEAEINVNHLTSKLTGTGNFKLTGTCLENYIETSGIGNVQAFNLICDLVDVDLSGIGNVEVNATKSLRIELSGSGNVYYKGSPTVEKNITGVGKVIDAN